MQLCNSPNLPVTASRSVHILSPSPFFQTSMQCVLILMRETKTFVLEMFKLGSPALFPLKFNFYIQRCLKSKYGSTSICPFSGNEWAVFFKETFRPWDGHARQNTLTKRPPGATYLTNSSLFCIFLNNNQFHLHQAVQMVLSHFFAHTRAEEVL